LSDRDALEAYASELNVSPDVHQDDLIYRYLVGHPQLGAAAAPGYYFSDGRKSALALRDIVEKDTYVDTSKRWTLLEFASGYGCVTRHFKEIVPEVDVVACDIHEQAVKFIQSILATDAVISTADPDRLWLGREFDVVFALSFFSHMPLGSWSRWLKALFRHVRPGGALIFTTHGYVTREKQYQNTVDLGDEGFWFVPASEQTDISAAEYGTTITSTEYVTRQIFSQLLAPISLMAPGFWWGHQDVYVVTKV